MPLLVDLRRSIGRSGARGARGDRKIRALILDGTSEQKFAAGSGDHELPELRPAAVRPAQRESNWHWHVQFVHFAATSAAQASSLSTSPS